MTFDEAAQATIDAITALVRAGRGGADTATERLRRLEVFELFLGDKVDAAMGEQVEAIARPMAAAHGFEIEVGVDVGAGDKRCLLITFTKLVPSTWSDATVVGELELDFELTLIDLTTDDDRREDLINTVAAFLADGNLAQGDSCTDESRRS